MKTVVMVPTYNESANIGRLIDEIKKLGIDADILVVDDDSPDGTSDIVREISDRDPKVHLITRKEKKGRGYAGIAGFKAAVKMGPEFVVEMDADFSHDPKYIPSLIEVCGNADVVIGSRGIAGGEEFGRGPARRLLTKLANLYIRILLGANIRDCTSGFRCFRRNVLESIGLDSMVSSGPSIVEEVLFRCKRVGFSFKEVPIIFRQREKGKSNLSLRKLFNTFWMVLKFWKNRDRHLFSSTSINKYEF